jgi:23S rRNA pseudouridine1911/1915/1917 synthase
MADVAAARKRLRDLGVEILLEDNHLLGVAKPAGLLSQGGPRGERSLVDALDRYRREAEGKPGRAYVGLVHRLDRNVSGAMVVAKTSKAASRLAAQFRARDVTLRKEYLAWVAGRPEREAEETVARLVRKDRVTHVAREVAAEDDEDVGDEAREASLRWRVEGRGPAAARLCVDLRTGRTHQIRAMLAAAGLPLVGDRKYGGPPAPRPALHAHRLGFLHPVGGAPVEVVAPIPADLRRLDRSLRISPPLARG